MDESTITPVHEDLTLVLDDIASVETLKLKGLSTFKWKGKVYISELFKMHDTYGLPLVVSITLCRERGYVPCLEQFVADAIYAWTSQTVPADIARERAERIVRDALNDARA